MENSKARAVLNSAALYLFWGGTYLGAKVALQTWPPFLLGTVRFLAAGSLMLAVGALLRHPLRLTRRTAAACLFNAIAYFPVCNGLVFLASRVMPSSTVALLNSLTPVWMTLMAWLFGDARVGLRVFVSLGLGVAGVAVLVGEGQLSGLGLSALAVVVSSMVWALASARTAHQRLEGTVLVRTGYQMVIGGLVFGLISLLTGDFAHLPAGLFGPASLVSLAYLVFCASFAGFLAFAWLNEHLPAHISGTYAYVNPIIAVILGTFAGEQLTIRSGVAAALVLGGIITSLTSSKVGLRLAKTEGVLPRSATSSSLAKD